MGAVLWCTTQVHPSGPRHSVCQLLGGLAPVTHRIILPWEFPLTEGVAFAQVYVLSLGASLHPGLADARVQRLDPLAPI